MTERYRSPFASHTQTRPVLRQVAQVTTASAMFVPFLCDVAGLPHSHLEIAKNWVNSKHDHGEMWQTMVRRTQFVHDYIFHNGSEAERRRVDSASWNWTTHSGDQYISAEDQEWLLNIENSCANIPGLSFPQDCQHPELTSTCGELLMQHFYDFQRRMR